MIVYKRKPAGTCGKLLAYPTELKRHLFTIYELCSYLLYTCRISKKFHFVRCIQIYSCRFEHSLSTTIFPFDYERAIVRHKCSFQKIPYNNLVIVDDIEV